MGYECPLRPGRARPGQGGPSKPHPGWVGRGRSSLVWLIPNTLVGPAGVHSTAACFQRNRHTNQPESQPLTHYPITSFRTIWHSLLSDILPRYEKLNLAECDTGFVDLLPVKYKNHTLCRGTRLLAGQGVVPLLGQNPPRIVGHQTVPPLSGGDLVNTTPFPRWGDGLVDTKPPPMSGDGLVDTQAWGRFGGHHSVPPLG